MNAVVTGATKGIGKAIVKLLAANKYNIAYCALNNNESDLLQAGLQHKYPEQTFIHLPTNCESSTAVEAFASFVLKNFLSINVLVNNAGLYIPSSFFDERPDDLEKQMQVNVYTPYHLCKTFGQKMKLEESGHIFNICSVASLKPVVSAASYSVTKFALLGLTKVLREELKPHKVKVTAVLPGSTLTNSWSGTDIPAERFVNADDVALAVLSCLNMSIGANVDEIIIQPVLGEI
jgi:hypothetical protein